MQDRLGATLHIYLLIEFYSHHGEIEGPSHSMTDLTQWSVPTCHS